MQKIHSINSTVVNSSDTSTTSDLIASVVSGHKLNASTNSSKKNLSTTLNGSGQNGGKTTIRTNIGLKSNSKIAAPAAPAGATVTVKPKTAAVTSTLAASSNGTINNNNNTNSQPNTTNNNNNNNNNSSHNNNNNNNILMSADIVNLANVLSAQTASIAPDAQAKQVLKEAVDAVVNSFAKHTQGYGRGEC